MPVIGVFAAAWIAALSPALAANTPASPEQDTLNLSKNLRPVPDEEWQSIAGQKIAENYTIIKGDTLYDISNRLFGDPKYWPKIWALNNRSITNPHLILPKNAITFTPGSGTSLPMVAIAPADEVKKPNRASDIPTMTTRIPVTPGRSQEWRKLERQPWESFDIALPEDVDPSGFDQRSRIFTGARSQVDMPVIITENDIEILGHVEGAISQRAFLNLTDEIVIASDRELQVGDTYAMVGEPNPIGSSESDRSGLSFPVYGKVRITAVRDGTFIGMITSIRVQIKRGDALVAIPPSPVIPSPVATETRIDATISKDAFLTPGYISQHVLAILDRGSEDGIKEGNVFRSYDYEDPYTGKKLVESDIFPDAEFIVSYCWKKFSLVVSTRGEKLYENGIHVRSLTDVSSLSKPASIQPVPIFESRGTQKETKELDNLDMKPGVGKQEEVELQQLETGDKPQPEGGPAPEDPPADLPPEAPPEAPPESPPTDESSLPAQELDVETPPPPSDIPPEEPPPPPTEPEAAPPETAPSSDSEDLNQMLGQ